LDFPGDNDSATPNWKYSPYYERHFSSFRNQPMFFLQIGTEGETSLSAWPRFFGMHAKVVGISAGTQSVLPLNNSVVVRTGARTDEAFLQSVLREFGIPAVVLDTGTRSKESIAATLKFLYPKLPHGSVYMIEELDKPGGVVDMPQSFVEVLTRDQSAGHLSPALAARQTFGISFYDGVVVLEKGGALTHGGTA
jgi:hypothetical protein